MAVSLVKNEDHINPVEKAIQLCDGLNALKPNDNVLIKPNLVIGGRKGFFPPFGRVTTSYVVENIVKCLHEVGCTNISIGEGSPVMKELESDTQSAFKFAGMDRISEQYGVKLLDFETGPFERIDLDGHNFNVVKAVLESDFLINVPVLKTHGQTIVSLGMKNLKGCLKFPSKKRFHKLGALSRLIAQLNRRIHSHLVIIDGTFALDHGPTMGTAHRMDVIVAGTDVFETELVGAALLGKEPANIRHIVEFAEMSGRSLDLQAVEVRGRKIEDLVMDLPWEADFNRCFSQFGLRGVHVNTAPADPTICSSCIVSLEYPNFMFSKDNPGLDLKGMEICCGEGARPTGDSSKIVLFGDCAIKNNKSAKNSTLLHGCPPDMKAYLKFLMSGNLSKGRATKELLVRVFKMMAFKFGIYKEDFGFWAPYQSPEFDARLYE